MPPKAKKAAPKAAKAAKAPKAADLPALPAWLAQDRDGAQRERAAADVARSLRAARRRAVRAERLLRAAGILAFLFGALACYCLLP